MRILYNENMKATFSFGHSCQTKHNQLIMHAMCVSLDVIANVICNSEKCYIRTGHESRIQCVRHCIAVLVYFPIFELEHERSKSRSGELQNKSSFDESSKVSL